ncbi:MAG: 5-(carboxyamino)imidazole ribonucleotide mutase [Candidatus Goldbacteria bacterium]|nr:5-(carboxyamino)imidazole ribonucleotide mutase [Candidatus Goldiibacteriota bacterium]
MKAAIVMGSDSDLEIMKETYDTLKKFGVDSYVSIVSAHRTPEKIKEFLDNAEKQNCEVIIAAAGMAAHLAGVIASHTIKPVIAVPMPSYPLNGADALLSSVQMPAGIPVATVTIGQPGAKNAAILAIQILSLKYPELKNKLKIYKKELAGSVIEKDRKLKGSGIKQYLKEKNAKKA